MSLVRALFVYLAVQLKRYKSAYPTVCARKKELGVNLKNNGKQGRPQVFHILLDCRGKRHYGSILPLFFLFIPAQKSR